MQLALFQIKGPVYANRLSDLLLLRMSRPVSVALLHYLVNVQVCAFSNLALDLSLD
jgi:hypothetical protein